MSEGQVKYALVEVQSDGLSEDYPSYAIIAVNESDAEAIRHLSQVVQDNSAYSIEKFDYSTVWLDSLPEELEDIEPISGQVEWLDELPGYEDEDNGFEFHSDIDTLVVTKDTFKWSAAPKSGVNYFSTQQISISALPF